MSDYGTMQSRIAGELARDDLETQIRSAIQDAIKAYQDRQWWFLEEEATNTTVAGTTFYGLPADFSNPKLLKIQYSNYWRDVQYRNWEYLENRDPGTTHTGIPTDWGTFRQQLRLYPTPNGAYTMRMSYYEILDALSGNTDTNAWMVEGENLIRARAKWELAINVIRDPELAAEAQIAEARALAEIERRNAAKVATGFIKPTSF